mgnify:CR=1 FL=1
MGDTPSLLYLLDEISNDDPSLESWGGSFAPTGLGTNTWGDKPDAGLGDYDGAATVFQHREAVWADFAARLNIAQNGYEGDPVEGEGGDDGTPTTGDGTGEGEGTLPGALDGIMDQVGAVVIVVRVEVGEDDDETLANVVGGVNATTGNFEGVHALLGAESVVGFAPRILCAPGFTHQKLADPETPGSFLANPVVAELSGLADRMRAVIIAGAFHQGDGARKGASFARSHTFCQILNVHLRPSRF